MVPKLFWEWSMASKIGGCFIDMVKCLIVHTLLLLSPHLNMTIEHALSGYDNKQTLDLRGGSPFPE